MRIVRTVQAMKHERAQWNNSVGFVPTMGYLHEGHLSLFRRARAENQVLVASIFVNPTQFGPHEDLETYPRDIHNDLHQLEGVGVDVVFLPSASEMYPPEFATYVVPEGPLTQQAEGVLRPGHFRGVATVVLKLFNTIQPDRAYFGQKDAQQVAVLTRMVTDLNVPTSLSILPTIREADGLALSSRNSYLTVIERSQAAILYRALLAGQQAFINQHNTDPAPVIQAMQHTVATERGARLGYAEIRHLKTFLPLTSLQAPAILLIAVQIGNTRLLDNFVLHADNTWDTGNITST